MTHNP